MDQEDKNREQDLNKNKYCKEGITLNHRVKG